MKLTFHENHRLLFGVVFFGFIALTVIVAVAPAIWVQDNNPPLPGSKALTAQEQRGLDIYVAEGCLYCHTQQVRPLPLDKPYGRPSAPADYARLHMQDLWRMAPEMLGTERTGPDLSNVAARQSSKTWNYLHLYNPRSVVKASVMQAYPWLFTIKETPRPQDVVVPVPKAYAPHHGKVVATQEAKDLVAYLLTLKQLPIPGSTPAGTSSQAAPSTQAASATGGTTSPEAAQGASLYGSRCASCHGQDGGGTPGVFPPLKGDPVVTAKDPSRHIQVVLFGLEHKAIKGVPYAAEMPAHSDLSDAQIAALVNHERTSWGNQAPTVTPQDVAKIRKQGKPNHEE